MLLINLAIDAVIAVCVFASRNWLKARIERGVQYHFDAKLEQLRSDLRANEEAVKKALRESEAEISALRASLFEAAKSHREMISKRQFESIDKIWGAVNRLAPLYNLARWMSHIKLEETTEHAKTNPKVSTFFKQLLETVPKEFYSTQQDWALSEQPFVSELLWAYFLCYKSVLTYYYMRAKEFEIGIGADGSFMTNKNVDELLRKTLPAWSDYMDQFGSASYFYMLDPIRDLILAEMRAILSGIPASAESVARAREVISATREVEKDLAKERATAD